MWNATAFLVPGIGGGEEFPPALSFPHPHPRTIHGHPENSLASLEKGPRAAKEPRVVLLPRLPSAENPLLP